MIFLKLDQSCLFELFSFLCQFVNLWMYTTQFVNLWMSCAMWAQSSLICLLPECPVLCHHPLKSYLWYKLQGDLTSTLTFSDAASPHLCYSQAYNTWHCFYLWMCINHLVQLNIEHWLLKETYNDDGLKLQFSNSWI